MEKNVICLKWGTKYGPHYVNNLYSMVKRNLKPPFRFVCFTEDSEGLNSEIETKPLLCDDQTMEGWWHKLAFFQPQVADLKGKMLFLDLDVTINSDIDCLFELGGDFNIIWEWNKLNELKNRGPRMPANYNSSVFCMEVGSHTHVWDTFLETRPDGPEFHNTSQRAISQVATDKDRVILHGDQDWINRQVPNAKIWPEGWVQSFKYGGLDRKDPNDCKVAVFHGHPNPEEAAVEAGRKHIASPWILSTWRNDTSTVTVTESKAGCSLLMGDKEYNNNEWKMCVANSVNFIKADHMLQDLPYSKAKEKIQLWYSRLQPGATLNLLEDDFAPTANTPNEETLMRLCSEGSPLSVYTFEMLAVLLTQIGFTGITRTEDPGAINITCTKA